MDFLNELNESQRQAATHVDGPMMVIAGAGSGKTRVLTYRIAYLMHEGVDPFNILALTFTNKAAREMKDRIAKVVGESEAHNLTMGTFHSVFARILRYHADKIGYPSNFTIYDSQDSKSLLKTIIKELGLDDKVYKPGLVHSRISSAKNNLISPDQYEANTEIVGEDRMSAKPKLYLIYKHYQQRCFKAGAMDFDDLLFKTNILLRDFPEVLQHYQYRFRYILVDEYQDTNYSQYLIVKKLAAMHENLCVVGDDAQSIYAFRGANIENILNFRKDYPDYALYKLEQNYRSTQTIVDAANSVIANNKEQIRKNVWTSNQKGSPIRVLRTLTDNEEGRVIAQSIHEIKTGQGREYLDFAILYRTNAQSRSFEEALRKLNIPYKIYGGLSFYQRKEIKDLLAYFRLSANPKDEEALKRIINYPRRGIGNTTIEELTVAANQYGVSMWEIITEPHSYPVALNVAAKTKVQSFATMIKSFSVRMETVSAFELAQEIAQSSGILRELHEDKSPEGVGRYENIQELLAGIKEFSDTQEDDVTASLSDFLVDVALLTDADNESDEDKNKVTLMTIHASKGLEFPFVYIVGLEENLFPSQMALHSRTELEEERRLFYVALTRAEYQCTLSYAMSRYKYGTAITCEPSRFIDEIGHEFLEHASPYSKGPGKSLNARNPFLSGGTRPSAPTSPPPGMRKLTPTSDLQRRPTASSGSEQDLKVGYNVMHERFGKGKIVKIEGVEPDKKVIVFFPKHGQKVLLLKFAKLEVLED